MLAVLAVTRFAEWLEAEMARRGVNRSTVAYLIGTTPSTLAAWVNEGRRPDTDSLRKLAAAWRLREEDVLRIAGHLSPSGEEPAAVREEVVPGWLVRFFEPLTPREREMVADLAANTAESVLALRESAEPPATPPPSAQPPEAPGTPYRPRRHRQGPPGPRP